MVACQSQQLLCVRALLPHADLDHRDKNGYTLLHLALLGGPAVLEVILARYVEAGLVDIPSGVDADNVIPPGRAPLMDACLSGRFAEAKMLLKAGASRYAKDSTGKCPLHYCLSGTSMAILQLLLGTAPNWHYTPEQLSDDTTGMPVLAFAVRGGSAEACKLLIAAGADKHAKALQEDGDEVVGYAHLARTWWPERPELAALFEPGAVHETSTPPCCANCLKSGIKLSACSKCHAVRYCSNACQQADWQQHKVKCTRPLDVCNANLAKYKK
jgi:hypothetical protein